MDLVAPEKLEQYLFETPVALFDNETPMQFGTINNAYLSVVLYAAQRMASGEPT